jgi:DNA-binding NarL/FixJ family response regulator
VTRENVKRISLLLADDHHMLTDALANVLRNDFEVLGTAHDGQSVVEMAGQYRPDVLIAEVSMSKLDGIAVARILREKVPSIKVLFLTTHHDASLLEEAFNAGATGFLVKAANVEELRNAVQTVARGEMYITPIISSEMILELIANRTQERSAQTTLTPRQQQILRLLAEGKTMKQAAAVMSISARTAETHKYQIMRKLGVKTTAALIRYAVRIKAV